MRYRVSDFEVWRESDEARVRWATSTWLATLPTSGSRTAHERELGRFLAWCRGAGVAPFGATAAHADAYLAETGGDRLAPSTLERRRARLRSFYEAAVAAGVVPANPFGGRHRPGSGGRSLAAPQDPSTTSPG